MLPEGALRGVLSTSHRAISRYPGLVAQKAPALLGLRPLSHLNTSILPGGMGILNQGILPLTVSQAGHRSRRNLTGSRGDARPK